MKKTFLAPYAIIFIAVSLTTSALAQLAPAGAASIQVSPGVYFGFLAEGTFTYGSTFTYLNYNTREFDSILTNLSADGSYSGTSTSTGRVVTGLVSVASISFTYNGTSASAPQVSSYGPTRAFAGNWLGAYVDPTLGLGSLHFGISSQGSVFLTAYIGFTIDAGIGTIDTSGNYSVAMLGGETLSGQFAPMNGRALGTVTSSFGTVGAYAAVRAITSRLGNISTRGVVGTGEQVLIGGFIITDGGKTVLVDAKGPSLAPQGVTNPVQATQISLYLGSQLIASNNGWRNNSNVAEIIASGLAPSDDRESALQVALEPGAYSVVVSSGDGSTGIGLVEVYGVGNTDGP